MISTDRQPVIKYQELYMIPQLGNHYLYPDYFNQPCLVTVTGLCPVAGETIITCHPVEPDGLIAKAYGAGYTYLSTLQIFRTDELVPADAPDRAERLAAIVARRQEERRQEEERRYSRARRSRRS